MSAAVNITEDYSLRQLEVQGEGIGVVEGSERGTAVREFENISSFNRVKGEFEGDGSFIISLYQKNNEGEFLDAERFEFSGKFDKEINVDNSDSVQLEIKGDGLLKEFELIENEDTSEEKKSSENNDVNSEISQENDSKKNGFISRFLEFFSSLI